MMGKGNCQIIALFSIFLVAMTFFPSGSAAENNTSLVRRKRNIICFLGLTGLISNAFYEALQSVREFDPLSIIGSLMNGKLQNGTLQGLSTLTNYTSVDVYCQDEMVSLDTLLGMTDVTFSFLWSVKVLLTFTGTISVTVDDLQFQLDGTLNMDNGIVFDVEVELTTLDNMSIGISGFGPLNYVFELIGDAVLDFFQHEVSNQIESALQTTLQSQLGNYKKSF